MNDTIERNVGIDPNAELYVIRHGDSYSHLGFDVVLDRIERYALNLGITETPTVVRGSVSAYDTMRSLMDALKAHYDETGERAVADLSPQLTGLEGYRVEVLDKHGERRRFIVGKSTGWLPIHLEIKRSDSRGGDPAALEYQSVRVLERVR